MNVPTNAPMREAPSTALVNPAGLRAHRLFQSRDLDDTRERISRVMQPHEVQARARPLRRSAGHMDFLRIGGLGLGTIDFGEAVSIDVGPLDGYHLLMFCLSGNADTRSGDRAVQARTTHGVTCAPGRAFGADLSADCEQLVVRMDGAMVQAHCGRALRFDESLDLTRPGMAAWLDQLRVLVGSRTLVDTAQRNPLIATELERLMVHLLLEGQPWQDDADGDADAAGPAISNAPLSSRGPVAGCVYRAENFIEAHAADPIRLADIAKAAGVPARTLLDAFRRFRGDSPMRHLRDVRLDRARTLLRGGDEGTLVSSIALDCGFAHLGRFSLAYQQRFGEAPSATLGRR